MSSLYYASGRTELGECGSARDGPQQAEDVIQEFRRLWQAKTRMAGLADADVDQTFRHAVFTDGDGGRGYRRLAHHYKWALSQAFETQGLPTAVARVIIVEEDLQIAPDFYEVGLADLEHLHAQKCWPICYLWPVFASFFSYHGACFWLSPRTTNEMPSRCCLCPALCSDSAFTRRPCRESASSISLQRRWTRRIC